MKKGRLTCDELKRIRKQIADANGIEYQISECHYDGDCPGTCPKCESELRYIEHELAVRQSSGKSVVLAGLAAGFTFFNAISCNPFQTTGDIADRPLQGEPVWVDSTGTQPSDSVNCPSPDTTDLDIRYILEGDIVAPANPEGLE